MALQATAIDLFLCFACNVLRLICSVGMGKLLWKTKEYVLDAKRRFRRTRQMDSAQSVCSRLAWVPVWTSATVGGHE